jgi:hypothetical protein
MLYRIKISAFFLIFTACKMNEGASTRNASNNSLGGKNAVTGGGAGGAPFYASCTATEPYAKASLPCQEYYLPEKFAETFVDMCSTTKGIWSRDKCSTSANIFACQINYIGNYNVVNYYDRRGKYKQCPEDSTEFKIGGAK